MDDPSHHQTGWRLTGTGVWRVAIVQQPSLHFNQRILSFHQRAVHNFDQYCHESLGNPISFWMFWRTRLAFKSTFLGILPPSSTVIGGPVVMSNGLRHTVYPKTAVQHWVKLVHTGGCCHLHLGPAAIVVNENMEVIFSTNWTFIIC